MKLDYDITIDLLQNRDFEYNKEKDVFEYVGGSIANYKKCVIHQPREGMFTLKDEDGEESACNSVYVELEKSQEAGYVETDWHIKMEGHVREDKLLEWLDNNGFKDRNIMKQKLNKRFREMQERKQQSLSSGYKKLKEMQSREPVKADEGQNKYFHRPKDIDRNR